MTTLMLKEKFHVIENLEELENVLRNIKPENIVLWRRMVDLDTFQPRVAFYITTDKPDFQYNRLGFVANLELLQNNNDFMQKWNEVK